MQLYITKKPLFFSHNSIDQLHPTYINTYFSGTWVELDKVYLNWVSQTEAQINLDSPDYTFVKLVGYGDYSFPFYFSVDSWEMMSGTGDKYAYKYNLNLNIHCTFLPNLFTYLSNNAHPIKLVRSNYGSSILSPSYFRSYWTKKDPDLNYEHEPYALLRWRYDYNRIYNQIYYNPDRSTTVSLTFPTTRRSMGPERPLVNSTDTCRIVFGKVSMSTGNKEYQSIKWYVFANITSRSFILVPSIGKDNAKIRAKLLNGGGAWTGYQNNSFSFGDSIATGSWNAGTNEGYISNTTNSVLFPQNDDAIEYDLVTNNSGFQPANSFIGAFFGPALTGPWTILSPTGRTSSQYLCVVMPETNLLEICHVSQYISSNQYIDYRCGQIQSNYSGYLNFDYNVRNASSTTVVNSYWLLKNMYTLDNAYNIFGFFNDSTISRLFISPTQAFINNRISVASYLYGIGTPYKMLLDYPQCVLNIGDGYQQYLAGVKNQQDTSLRIAKQEMWNNSFDSVVGGASTVATSMTSPFGGVGNAISGVWNMLTGGIKARQKYKNQQKMIDAKNKDAFQSSKATVMSSTTEDSYLNAIYAEGFPNKANIVISNSSSDSFTSHPEIPLLYISSLVVRFPQFYSSITANSNYLFNWGIYVNETIPSTQLMFHWRALNSNISSSTTADFIVIDVEIPKDYYRYCFTNLNEEYVELLDQIFENKMRLWFRSQPNTSSKKVVYQPWKI